MDSRYDRANSWSNVVIGAAIEVHRIMGPGLLESVYQRCLERELKLRGMSLISQARLPLLYKGGDFAKTDVVSALG